MTKRTPARKTSGKKPMRSPFSKARFEEMIEENLAVPFETMVLGVSVTVERIDLNRSEQIVAACRRGRDRQALPILDLPLPAPPPDGAEWIEAYRKWRGEG